MNGRHVGLIFWRELREQLRDRRTLFVVLVLPVLLYPILGMGMFQVAQFMRETPSVVTVIGEPTIPGRAELLDENGHIAPRYGGDERLASLLDIRRRPLHSLEDSPGGLAETEAAQADLKSGAVDLVVVFPRDFGSLVEQAERGHALPSPERVANDAPAPLPRGPQVFHNSAHQKSKIAAARMARVLDKWNEALGQENLTRRGFPPSMVHPFQQIVVDVADDAHRGAAVWSRVLPVILLLWTLTGAFYPAIDLCAGEKERGTLEALLTSPASRTDIVVGKLLTVMVFSLATAGLNLVAVTASGVFIMRRLAASNEAAAALGIPPVAVVAWMLLAALPLAALFSALSLGLAAFAKSSKEGQYYLMPLMLVALPLLMLAMSPAAELSLGTSLIPITGMMLLLRALCEGNAQQALAYLVPAMAVTISCGALAVRWSVAQFHSESVLFREQEKFDLWLWIRHLLRNRQDLPTPALALFAGVLILVLEFFASMTFPVPASTGGLLASLLATQLGVIAAPILILAWLCTKNPRRALRMHRPRLKDLLLAAILAVALHPITMGLLCIVQWMYPSPVGLLTELQRHLAASQSVGWLLAAITLAPAICEELAFRGFILSGLLRPGRVWSAILVSSLFFALAHPIAQQAVVAALVGMVIAYVAVRTRSIFPGMVFHIVHNTIVLLAARLTGEFVAANPMLHWIVVRQEHAFYPYHWYVAAAGAILAVALFVRLGHACAASSSQVAPRAEPLDAPQTSASAWAQG